MGLFDRFTKKEKYNTETGKFETVQSGMNLKKNKPKGPYDQLMQKYYEKHPEQKPSAKIKSGLKKAGKKYMDLSEQFVKSQQRMQKMQQQKGHPLVQMPFINPMIQNNKKKAKKIKSWKEYEHELENLPKRQLKEIAKRRSLRGEVAKQILEWQKKGEEIAENNQPVNPFMNNPFYNPFVMLQDNKKKKRK